MKASYKIIIYLITKQQFREYVVKADSIVQRYSPWRRLADNTVIRKRSWRHLKEKRILIKYFKVQLHEKISLGDFVWKTCPEIDLYRLESLFRGFNQCRQTMQLLLETLLYRVYRNIYSGCWCKVCDRKYVDKYFLGI